MFSHAPNWHPGFCGQKDEPKALGPDSVTCPKCRERIENLHALPPVSSMEEAAELLALLEHMGVPMDQVQVVVRTKDGKIRNLGTAASMAEKTEAQPIPEPIEKKLPKPLMFVRGPKGDQ